MTDLPYGYRWALEEDMDRDDAIVVMRTVDASGIPYTQDEADLAVPWDCMVKFGFGHDHDAEVCEAKMFATHDRAWTSDHWM